MSQQSGQTGIAPYTRNHFPAIINCAMHVGRGFESLARTTDVFWRVKLIPKITVSITDQTVHDLCNSL
jgi:hypothetical protein